MVGNGLDFAVQFGATSRAQMRPFIFKGMFTQQQCTKIRKVTFAFLKSFAYRRKRCQNDPHSQIHEND